MISKVISAIFRSYAPNAVLTRIILYLCLGGIVFLLISGILPFKEALKNFSIFLGWIVAFLLLSVQLIRTREDNVSLKKEEIKKNLQIEAFKEINKSTSDFSTILTNLSTNYLMLPTNLKLHRDNPHFFKFDKITTELELNNHIPKLLNGLALFLLAIEANEIAIIQYGHLHKKIAFEINDLQSLIRSFQKFLSATSLSDLTTDKYNELKQWCDRLHGSFLDIQMYLFDYRIELMNQFLGDIFDTKVPERQPLDPKCKTLKELATKVEVEKEEKERQLRAYKGGSIK